jgi:thiol-disulfide isomerase/thioredoxin
VRLLTLLFLTALAACSQSREPMPAFHARSLEGRNFDNVSTRGKPVLIQLWATWCQYCKRDEPAVETIIQDHAKKDGLIVLAVNANEPKQKVVNYLKDSPRSAHIVLTESTNITPMFGETGLPAYVLIDKDGKIANAQKGSGGLLALRELMKSIQTTK